MEQNIVVGILVGITVACSAYIWNNKDFNRVQKVGLLVCFVFPPAQWLGILIVLTYNSNRDNNTVERKTEKKLDSKISDLTELKEKGILTEEEHKTKVEKIKTEKLEHYLKSSIEYKQLKSLFDSGVLTKEEFENKTRLINEKIVLDAGEVNENPTNPWNIENNTGFFIFLILIIIIIIIAINE